MNKFKKILSSMLAVSMVMGLASCRDDWSNENTDEGTVTVASPAMLLTGAEFRMYPHGYTLWFYSAPTYYAASQMAGFSGSYTEGRLKTTAGGQHTAQMMNQLRYFTKAEFENSLLTPEAQEANKPYMEALRVLAIYGGIYDADNSGDMPYTEGGRYEYGGKLKPNYDKVEDLYPLWNTELKNAVAVFKAQGDNESSSDVIYNGNWSKWAKFASSLRVKIATRLIHRNLALAKTIVAEAVADGVITDMSEDVMYAKADSRLNGSAADIDAGEIAFGSGNNTINNWGGAANKKVVDWMFKNRDPRLRFQYEKNNWNARIVDWFLTNDHESYIQPCILERVEKNAEGGFGKWKDEFGGDLWARYIGLPDNYAADKSKDPYLMQFYSYGNTPADGGYQFQLGESKYTYRPFARLSERMIMTNANYTAPRVPGVNAAQADDELDVPRVDMYMTAAEVNFYLAEFATYGGVAGLDAPAAYFKKAVEQSVRTWDKFANLNNMPYYRKTYNYSTDDVSIALQDGEVEALLAQPDFQLTGNKADDLEKIFLNLEIHFMYMPMEHWVTARRSGIPKYGSNLIARTNYESFACRDNYIARRSNFGAISPTDQMADILKGVYERQGFTLNVQDASDGLLNSERLWQDVGAPQWGAGPNVGI